MPRSRPEPFAGTLVCGLSDVDGVSVWTLDKRVEVPANGVLEPLKRSSDELALSDPTRFAIVERLMRESRLPETEQVRQALAEARKRAAANR